MLLHFGKRRESDKPCRLVTCHSYRHLLHWQYLFELPTNAFIDPKQSLVVGAHGLPNAEGPVAAHISTAPLVPKVSQLSSPHPDHKHRRGVCENPAAHASLFMVGRWQQAYGQGRSKYSCRLSHLCSLLCILSALVPNAYSSRRTAFPSHLTVQSLAIFSRPT